MTDSKAFRSALGSFATGVCVVTAVDPKIKKAIGMTINSFSSVSLDPPLILWSIQNDSDCFEVFSKAETFTVSVLSREQESLSNLYAQKGAHVVGDEHRVVGHHGGVQIADTLAAFECRTWATYPGGDHTIIVGQVEGFSQSGDGVPLLFYAGGYNELKG